MKWQSILLGFVVIMAIHWASLLYAQVPGIINYQGRVSVNGTNFSGTGSFRFALVNGAVGTTNYWSNDGSPVGLPLKAVPLSVTKGLYSVLLGDTTISNMTAAIPGAIFGNSDVRLRVWFSDGVTGIQQLSPDQRLGAVGYALMAASVPVGAIGTAQLASNAVTAANIAPGAVTTVTLATGAVGPNQLASNAITAANLATAGALTNVAPQYWATNQYYLIASFASTNRGSVWDDLTGLYLSMSADGTNVVFTGPQPLLGGAGILNINDPTIWSSTDGALFYTWTTEPDIPTSTLLIYSANGLGTPNLVTTLDFSSLVTNLSQEWIFAPQIDATPGIVPSNMFVAISTNNLASKEIYMFTCTNVPLYSLWTTPVRVPISGSGFSGLQDDPVGFTYHGTNMLMFGSFDSLLLATNATSPGSGYAIWKGHNWGGWTNAAVDIAGGPSVVFLPDRIRIYMSANYTAITSGLPTRFVYSDCFDDWKTWTPLAPVNGPPGSPPFLRSCSVLPVVTSNDLQNTLATRLGLPLVVAATTLTVQGAGTVNGGLTVQGGLTAGNTVLVTGITTLNGGLTLRGIFLTNSTTLSVSNIINVLDSSAGAFTVTLPNTVREPLFFYLTNANPAAVTLSNDARFTKFNNGGPTFIMSNKDEVAVVVNVGNVLTRRYQVFDSKADVVNFGSAAATTRFVYGIANDAGSAPTATVNNATLVITNSLGGGFVFYQSTEDGAAISNTVAVVNATSNSVLSFVSDKQDSSTIDGVPTDGNGNAGYPIPPGGYVKILAIAADKWVVIGTSGSVFVAPNKRFWYQTVNNSGTVAVIQQP